MTNITATISYANTGSGKYASGIGWIDWGNFSLNVNESSNITLQLKNNLTLSFTITNYSDSLILMSDTPLNQSSFGTEGYTGIQGNIALSSFNDYYPTSTQTSIVTLSNINVTDSNNNIVGCSIVFSSIQYDSTISSYISTNDTQQISTNGGCWNEVAWLGNTNSPIIDDTDKRNIIITTTSPQSGSPVYYTDSPTSVTVKASGETLVPQYAFGIAVASLDLRKCINGRISNDDQFNLSITGSKTDLVTTTGNTNGIQSEIASVNGSAGSIFTINESMTSSSVSALTNYTQNIVWINNSPDGTPVPTTGYLGQSINVDVGDDFVVTISNTPKATTNKADPLSGPEADNLSWINWQYFELNVNCTAQILAPISPTLTLLFDITNNSNAIVKGAPITNSAFGSLLYTGLVGNNCLEITCNTSPVILTISNIQLINTQRTVSYDYSMVLASIQYSSNAPENYTVTQEFITNGSPWSQLAWGGVLYSPIVAYSNNNHTITITTTNAVSGSPVFISDPPTELQCTFTSNATPFVSRISLSVLPTQILQPSRGVNIFRR